MVRHISSEYPETEALIKLFQEQLCFVGLHPQDKGEFIIACQRINKILKKALEVAENLETVIYCHSEEFEELLALNKRVYGFSWVQGMYSKFYRYDRPYGKNYGNLMSIIQLEILEAINDCAMIILLERASQDIL